MAEEVPDATGPLPYDGMTSAVARLAALAYARRKWLVFPLHTPRMDGTGHTCSCGRHDCTQIGKHPRVPHGLKDGTTDTRRVQSWWGRQDDANIGVVTGRASGLVVLDVDPRHGGVEALHTLCERHGDLPQTLVATTGGGGLHYLFAHPRGDVLLRNKAGLDGLEGLDIRGDGGYIVAAPSLHASGNRYAWTDASVPVAALPDWLLALLLELPAPPPDAAPRIPVGPYPSGAAPFGVASYWLDRALQDAREGNRNETGKWLALQLRDTARLSEAEAEAVMVTYAAGVEDTGETPYTEREARATLRSIYARPAREPARSQSALSALVYPAFSHSLADSSSSAYAPYSSAPWVDSATRPPADVLDEPSAPGAPYEPRDLMGSTGDFRPLATSPSLSQDQEPEASRLQPLEPHEPPAHGTPDTSSASDVSASPAQPVRPAQPAGSAQTAKPSRFRFLSIADLRAMPKPEWLVGDVLPANRLSVVYGEYGSAKSFLVLDWGLHVACGRSWMGHKVKQGLVVYVAGEGLGGISKRVSAWGLYHKVDTEQVPFRVVGSAPQLMRPGDVADFVAALREFPYPPALVILDTLSRCLVGGDENSQKDMGIAVAGADVIREQFGAHVLLVHHKPNSAPGGNGNGRTRGSSVLPGAADTLIDVTRDNKLVTVACPKQKEAQEFDRMYLEMRGMALDEQAHETSVVLVPRGQGRDGSDGASADSRKRELMTHVLAQFPQGLGYTDWQTRCANKGLNENSFSYHFRILRNAGVIVEREDAWVLGGVSVSGSEV